MRARRSTGILVAILAILALTLTGCSAPTLTPPSLSSDTPAVFAYYENDGSGGLEALNASNGQPMWKTQVGNMYVNSFSSVVMANGVVYGIADHNFSIVGEAQHSPPAPRVIAVRASDGKLLWRLSEPNINGAPYIAADSSIVVLSDDGGLRGFDPTTGKQRWHIAEGGYPLLVRHGIIYIGSTNLLAVRASDGATLWQTPFDYSFKPLVGNDHALYAGTMSGILLGWDAHTGQRLTSDSPYAVGDHDQTRTRSGIPLAASEKVVLLASNKTYLPHMQAFSAVDGRLLWEVEVPRSFTPDVSLTAAPTYYIRTVGDFIYIIDGSLGITALRMRDGSLAWRQDYPDYAVQSFSVSGGVVFALLRSNSSGPCGRACGVRIVALDATSGASSWRRDVERAGFFPLPAQ